MSTICLVCESRLDNPIFKSPNSLTSLGNVHQQATEVWWCENCTHLQNTPITDIMDFYDKNYNILINSEEEDQLYFDLKGRKKFRIQHQVDCISKKLDIPLNAKVLDYGAGKGLTLRNLCDKRQDLIPHLFDVSDVYVKFWNKFCLTANYSTYRTKDEWKNYFDCVFSFFALEHAERPLFFLKEIFALLNKGGIIYGIVPYVYNNPGDFCVLDHVNHFSGMSLGHLLSKAGFEDIEIDTQSHYGAIIFAGKKIDHKVKRGQTGVFSSSIKENMKKKSLALIKFWTHSIENINSISNNPDVKRIAVYGSGFYGSFIANNMLKEKIMCFLDQNPHRYECQLYNKPIMPPNNLPKEITDIVVGLNPNSGYKAIDQLKSLWSKNIKIHFPYPSV